MSKAVFSFLFICWLLPQAAAQVVVTTDTVSICTGAIYTGIQFGRDSLLLTDTTAQGDTIHAIFIHTRPVYMLIIDTTIVRGSYFSGTQIFENTAVHQYGQTTTGCDSNITWVIYFGQKPYTPLDISNLNWKFKVYPSPLINSPLYIELKPQTADQIAGVRVTIRLWNMLGSTYQPVIEPDLERWTVRAGGALSTTVSLENLPAGVYIVQINLNEKQLGLARIVHLK